MRVATSLHKIGFSFAIRLRKLAQSHTKKKMMRKKLNRNKKHLIIFPEIISLVYLFVKKFFQFFSIFVLMIKFLRSFIKKSPFAVYTYNTPRYTNINAFKEKLNENDYLRILNGLHVYKNMTDCTLLMCI